VFAAGLKAGPAPPRRGSRRFGTKAPIIDPLANKTGGSPMR